MKRGRKDEEEESGGKKNCGENRRRENVALQST